MARKRKNNLCPRGHLVLGHNAISSKDGYTQCRICRAEFNKKRTTKSKDLPTPVSEKREDDLNDPIFIPNGELTYYYNLRNGNRHTPSFGWIWNIDYEQD